jgi:flagellar hook-basal body complex protein FliE
MSIQQAGLKAYSTALRNFTTAERSAKTAQIAHSSQAGAARQVNSFADTLSNSLSKVNNLQSQKDSMIQAFASGENQNVHELMISLQKAGLAMNMTATVRNKVLEAYKELSRIQF